MRRLFKILISIIFLCSSIAKLLDLDSFEYSITLVLSTDRMLTYFIMTNVIMLELLCSILILFNKFSKVAIFSLGILTIAFIFFLAYAIFLIGNYNCNCFGILDIKTSPFVQIIIDIFLLAVISYLFDKNKKTIKKDFITFLKIYSILTIMFFVLLVVKYNKRGNFFILEKSIEQIFPQIREKNFAIVTILNSSFVNCSLCFDKVISNSKSNFSNLGNNDSLLVIVNKEPSNFYSSERMQNLFNMNSIKTKVVVKKTNVLNKYGKYITVYIKKGKIINYKNILAN